MAKRDYDYLFKLVLIGDSGVGKSCLLLRFAVSGAPLPPLTQHPPLRVCLGDLRLFGLRVQAVHHGCLRKESEALSRANVLFPPSPTCTRTPARTTCSRVAPTRVRLFCLNAPDSPAACACCRTTPSLRASSARLV